MSSYVGTPAVARNVGFGCRDVGRAVLWFDAYMDPSRAALLVIEGEEALDVIANTGVRDVHDLEGKPLFVLENNGIVQFLEFWPLR